jgi:hypothetical protein
MPFRFTLFNSITLLVMAATLWTGFARWRFRVDSNWFALYYFLILGFWFGFDGSLNTAWTMAGVAAAIVLRANPKRATVLNGARVLEAVFFGYVLWRGLGLLLLW